MLDISDISDSDCVGAIACVGFSACLPFTGTLALEGQPSTPNLLPAAVGKDAVTAIKVMPSAISYSCSMQSD